jgi:small subunit ribosomal protein S21
MSYVEVKGTTQEALDRAMAEFKNKVKRADIFQDLKRHEYHVKPSVRRKLKQQEAFKRRRREENARIKSKGDRSRRSPQSTKGERSLTE